MYRLKGLKHSSPADLEESQRIEKVRTWVLVLFIAFANGCHYWTSGEWVLWPLVLLFVPRLLKMLNEQ